MSPLVIRSAILLGALAVASVYVLRVDAVVGMMVDDGWYVMLAEALATGQGYRLVNAPGSEFILPGYPPGFPALLSLVFRAQPSFPANLWLLKAVSVAAMLGAELREGEHAL